MVLFVFAFLAILVSISSVSAATVIYVDNATGNDANDGLTNLTAKATIQNGTDTVDVGGTVYVADGTYQEHLIINKDVNLIGQSTTGTIIDGTHNGRPVTINSGLSVNMTNFTITNGNSSGGYGGGICCNYGGTLVITNCDIINNINNGDFSAAKGGGIYMDNGFLTMDNCNLINNSIISDGLTYGGGIRFLGTLNLTNCNFINNTATSRGSNSGGGGISCHGTLSMTNCNFTNNTVNAVLGSAYGGGIYNEDGSLNLTNCNITGNIANNAGSADSNGGGVCFLHYASVTIYGCNIVNNTATSSSGTIRGGGIYHNSGPLVLNFSRIVNNTPNAIYRESGQTNNVEDNWWGSNNPEFSSLLVNVQKPTNWLYMTINASPSTINNTQTSLITVSFNNRYNGTDVVAFDPVGGHIPDGVPVSFVLVNGPYGTFVEPSIGYTAGGLASMLFTSNACGIQSINGTLDNQSVETSVTIEGTDLFVTKDVDDNLPDVGQLIMYTITAFNSGISDSATGVVVADLLPAGVTFDHASSADYNATTGVWTIGDLGAGEFRQLFIWAVVNAHLMSPSYTNTAFISGNEWDWNLSNNVENETIYSPTVDIVVSKSVNDTTPNYRDLVTFTVTARNDGPSNATGVVLDDLLPTGLALVSAIWSLGSYDNVTGVWTIGNLADGASAVLTLVAQVMDANKTLTNSAVLAEVDQYDSNPLDNGALVDLLVPAAADIQVTKTTNNTNPWVAENFLWTVTVRNNGPNDATGVQIFDLLPAGLNLVSFTASQGGYNALTGVWSIGTLLNGSTATLAFVVNAMDSLSGSTVTNTATKSAETQYDWNTSNNVASSSISVPAKKTFSLSVKNTGTGRIKAVYYVTVYQPGNAAPIYKKYVFYLNPGKSTSFTIGTYAIGTAISTDEMVYNYAYSKKTVSLVNTWTATGLAPYVQNFVVANVPASVSKGAIARKRFWINQASLGVQIVVPPKLM